MTRSGSRGWAAFTLVGLALWIGATVVATVVNDDAADPRPIVLTFAAGGAVFFGAIFGVALWQTRPRTDPELDALLTELAVEPAATRLRASLIGTMRRVAPRWTRPSGARIDAEARLAKRITNGIASAQRTTMPTITARVVPALPAVSPSWTIATRPRPVTSMPSTM